MFSALLNSFKVKELQKRMLFTFGIIVLCRFAANIPTPGVDPVALDAYFNQLASGSGGGMMNMFNLFSGGALQKFAIATLGIMPYISASIIIQLMTPVIPSLEKLRREGEHGRAKITNYTRYLTVIICLFQGVGAALAMVDPSRIPGLSRPSSPLVVADETTFVIMTTIILTCTTMVYMWLGEQITDKGIGNGVSLIITINIIARLPNAVMRLYEQITTGQTLSGQPFRPVHLFILILLFVGVTAATIILTQGQRRVPIQMARRAVAGGKIDGGTTYMPLKVNFAGVMPIIFAQPILMVMSAILSSEYLSWTGLAAYFSYRSPSYMLIYAVIIILFTYFWVANQFNPIQIADNLKREGAYIPGVRPGEPTAMFLDNTMTRITFVGAIFLTALAIFPMVIAMPSVMDLDFIIAQFFGGTSLLIMVGVVLDTLTQMEAHVVMQNYDGFLSKGRLRGRA
jgi:preprotein translocase subunit SecY